QQLRARAEVLPDVSLELIYHSSSDLTEGNRSKLFTLRTTEKSSELVASAINRLLGDELKNTQLAGYTLNQVTLVFPAPVSLDRERVAIAKALREHKLIKDARPAQSAAGLLGGALALSGAAGDDFSLTGEAKEELKKGQFKSAVLNLKNAVDGDKLAAALRPLTRGGKDRVLEGFQVAQAQLALTDFAYLAQVTTRLESQLRSTRVASVNLTEVRGTEEKDGRFKEMQVSLPTAVDGEKFTAAMKSFANELQARPLPVRLENFDSQ